MIWDVYDTYQKLNNKSLQRFLEPTYIPGEVYKNWLAIHNLIRHSVNSLNFYGVIHEIGMKTVINSVTKGT